MIYKRILFDRISGFWMVSTLTIILLLPLIIGTALYFKAMPLFETNNLFRLIGSSEWLPTDGKFGFWPFITSSIYVTLLSFIFAAPVSLLAGLYLTQFAPKKLILIMHPVIDILAGLPSVIYGVWGVLVIVPFIGRTLAPLLNINSSGYTILAGGIVLVEV